MRLREALVQSRNLVSVRLLDGMGVDYARKYISEFGFAESELPPNLSMSLGTASLTLCRRGYARVRQRRLARDTWLIDQVNDRDGSLVFKENPALAAATAQQRPAGQPGGGRLQLRRSGPEGGPGRRSQAEAVETPAAPANPDARTARARSTPAPPTSWYR